MWCLFSIEIDAHLIDVAPSPPFRRIIALNDGMARFGKSRVARRRGESSQQPTWPHVRHRRRWTQRDPIFRQSSQPSALGTKSQIPGKCSHLMDIKVLQRPSPQPHWSSPDRHIGLPQPGAVPAAPTCLTKPEKKITDDKYAAGVHFQLMAVIPATVRTNIRLL